MVPELVTPGMVEPARMQAKAAADAEQGKTMDETKAKASADAVKAKDNIDAVVDKATKVQRPRPPPTPCRARA